MPAPYGQAAEDAATRSIRDQWILDLAAKGKKLVQIAAAVRLTERTVSKVLAAYDMSLSAGRPAKSRP